MNIFRHIFALSALCIVHCALCTCRAATYFASPSASGSGTFASPASLADGIDLLYAPGDTLYLLGGQYDLPNTRLRNKVGTASRPIVIASYPGQQAILDFRTTAYGTRGLQIESSCSYLHIIGLTLRYSGKNKLYNEGSYCTFERLDIYGSADTGCQMKNGGNNLIINCDSHDNFDYKHTNSEGQADYGGNADGFADKQHSGAPNHYIGCRSWNNSDDGWDFFQRVTTAETVIESCVCYQNGPAEYNMQGHPRYQVDKSWFDQINGTTITNRYGEQQVVSLDHYPNHGNGNGFKVGGYYTSHLVLVHHCLAVANTVKGFDQNNNGGTMRFLNCTGYANGYDYGFTTAYGTLSIQNCLSFASKGGNATQAQTTLANDHNSWNRSTRITASAFLSVDTTVILAPRAADGSLALGNLFVPSASSGLIDAGTPVGLVYYGSAPEIGFYEIPEGEPVLPDDQPADTVPTYVCSDDAHRIAFVTTPDASEDRVLLAHLRACDTFCIDVLDAALADNDYSPYEVIVVGSKPSSTAPAFNALKGYNAPMLVLKPWVFKPSAWNWGTAINTQDLSVAVANPSHPLFTGLTFAADGSLPLFTQCATNAVTAISAWNSTTGFTALACPSSQAANNVNYQLSIINYQLPTALALFPSGTVCNGTTLAQPLIMIGLSEYSTAYLTDNALRLVDNALFTLLGLTPQGSDQPTTEDLQSANCSLQPVSKILTPNSSILIIRNGHTYDALGRLIY